MEGAITNQMDSDSTESVSASGNNASAGHIRPHLATIFNH